MHYFFFLILPLTFGEVLKHVLLDPKTNLEKNKPALSWMNTSHGLGPQQESREKKKWRNSDDFGLRSPVIQETFSPKKGIPLP